MKLSAYILTHNSEQFLNEIIIALNQVADEILIIDSGSLDRTKAYAETFEKVNFIYHPFENFKAQRIYAEQQCQHNLVLFLDSDEIPDNTFIYSVNAIKQSDSISDVYTVSRNWTVLGKQVHCIYPIVSPDFPIRLYQKSKASFKQSNLVHENLAGYKTKSMLAGSLNHITMQTKEELYAKLEFYTDIAAKDLLRKGKSISTLKTIFSPMAAFIKWYFLKGGFKDGVVGFVLAEYAYLYTLKKYQKAELVE